MATQENTQPKRSPGRPARGGKQPGRIVVPCSIEFDAWYRGLARELRSNGAAAFERVIAEWCEQTGRPAPPPRMPG